MPAPECGVAHWIAPRRARSPGTVDRAGQIVGPVPLEEWATVPVPATDGPGVAGEADRIHANMNLLPPVLVAFGDEADIHKRAGSGLGDAAAFRGTDAAGAAASPASFEVEIERLQNRLGSDRALAPLQRPQRLVGAVAGDSPLPDRFVERVPRFRGAFDPSRITENCRVIAHPVLDVPANGRSGASGWSTSAFFAPRTRSRTSSP